MKKIKKKNKKEVIKTRKFLEAFGLKEDEDDVFGVHEQEQAAKKIINIFGEDVIEFTEYIAGEYLFTLVLPTPDETSLDFSIYNNKAYLSAMSYDDHMDTLSVRYNEAILRKILIDGIKDDEIIVLIKNNDEDNFDEDVVGYEYIDAFSMAVIKEKELKSLLKSGYNLGYFSGIKVLSKDNIDISEYDNNEDD